MNPARRGFQRRLEPEQRRSKRLWFRVNSPEYRAIATVAHAAGSEEPMDWVRRVVLAAAGIRQSA